MNKNVNIEFLFQKSLITGGNAYPWKKQDTESHTRMAPFFMKNIYKITNKNSNSDQNNSKGLTHFFPQEKLYIAYIFSHICMGKDRVAKEIKKTMPFLLFGCFV